MHGSSMLGFGISGCVRSRAASKDDRTASILIGLDSEVGVFPTPSPSTRVFGGLIQAAVGSGLGDGRPLGNRSGFFANASASMSARFSRFAAASPKCTSYGVNSPSPT